jgi:hypothetical protein
MSHPGEEQLLLYADGESPARDAAKIRLHLEACWECRGAMEELQETVGQCVRYRKNVLQACLPPPPAPWGDIRVRFDRIDAAFDRASFWVRAARALRSPGNARRWASVAVACLVFCVLFYRFRQTPSVEASELLRKAIAAAEAHPEKPRRIQIRTKDMRVTRLAGMRPRVASDDVTTDTRQLQALFRSADYDWDDPLSARAYQSWRDRLADKRDEVARETDSYRIRTMGSGELAAATLKIRMQDFRPVEERFEFRNREWVEITELDEETATESIAAAGERTDGAKPRRVFPLNAERLPGTPSHAATIGDELRVLAALNQVGADLGDPIEVSRAKGDILVSGVGIAPQRQEEIQGALRSQKHVVVRFSESAPVSVPQEREAPMDSTASTDVRSQLQGQMAEQMGGRVYFVQLGAQVLDLSESMMSRAYALRRLAEQIPIGIEPELSPQDWQILKSLRREHSEALRRQAAEIDRLLRPALASVSRPRSAGVASPEAWQPATEELFQSARRVDKLLAAVFGASAGEPSSGQLPSQLQAGLAELNARLDAYSLLSQQSVERPVPGKDK